MSLPRCRAAGRSTRAGAAGCVTPASASTSAASARRARSRARARRGLRSPGAASSRSLWPSARRTRPMRPTARAGSRATGAASAAARRAPTGARRPEREGQHDRPRLAAAQGGRHRLRAGLQRAGGGQRRADRARRRDLGRLAGLRAARADGRRDRRRAQRAGVAEQPRSAWPTPAPGTTSRSTASPPTASRCDPARRRASEKAPGPGWQGGRYEWMRRVLATQSGQRLYRKRSQTVEPMFGHTKHNRGMSRFHRRGRSAVRTEWRLIAATHNLVKLHRHTPGGPRGVNRGPIGTQPSSKSSRYGAVRARRQVSATASVQGERPRPAGRRARFRRERSSARQEGAVHAIATALGTRGSAVRRKPPVRDQPLIAPRVQATVAQAQLVAAPARDDLRAIPRRSQRAGAAARRTPDHLERRRRRLFAPKPVHQPVARDRRALMQRQQRQQRARLARHRWPPAGRRRLHAVRGR